MDSTSLKVAQEKLEAKLEGLHAELVDTQTLCRRMWGQSQDFGKVMLESVPARVKAEIDKKLTDELQTLLSCCMNTMIDKLPSMVDDQLTNLAVEVKKHVEEAQAEIKALQSQVKYLTESQIIFQKSQECEKGLGRPTSSLTESDVVEKRSAALAESASLQQLVEVTKELEDKLTQEFQDRLAANTCQSGRIMQNGDSLTASVQSLPVSTLHLKTPLMSVTSVAATSGSGITRAAQLKSCTPNSVLPQVVKDGTQAGRSLQAQRVPQDGDAPPLCKPQEYRETSSAIAATCLEAPKETQNRLGLAIRSTSAPPVRPGTPQRHFSLSLTPRLDSVHASSSRQPCRSAPTRNTLASTPGSSLSLQIAPAKTPTRNTLTFTPGLSSSLQAAPATTATATATRTAVNGVMTTTVAGRPNCFFV
jgi:hypothetical protein